MNIVFDFGAVLFTWRPVDIVAEVFPHRATNADQAKQLAQSLFGHDDWQDFDRGLLPMDVVAQRTAKRLDLEEHALLAMLHGIADRLVPMQETLQVLDALRCKRESGAGVNALYFLSNMPAPYARELEQRHAFLRHFDGGIFSGDELCSKPDPRIYQLLQSRYHLAPESTVFIDDLPVNIEAARALGWKGVHFTSAQQLAADLSHHYSL